MKNEKLAIGISQIAPVYLNKDQTILKIIAEIDKAGSMGCELVVFGEGILPGYPFWIELTDGARFNSEMQKNLFAYYFHQAIQTDTSDLKGICAAALKKQNSGLPRLYRKSGRPRWTQPVLQPRVHQPIWRHQFGSP